MNQPFDLSRGRRESDPVLRPGDNCWCVEEATRISVIIDAAAYFAAFAESCEAARHQILILGWDFDRCVKLYRDTELRDLPDRLGAFLIELVRRRRGLNIYLLSWDFNMIYAAERELLPALRLRLQAPPRFHFRLDDRHPKGASHHQKLVVIDDRIAFAGGIDLSRWRWDTSDHAPKDPRRVDPDGKPYPPFHDMMMLVEGPVATKLGDLARDRWRRARGWRIDRASAVESSPWPASIEPWLRSQPVAIARTEPEYLDRPAVQEIKQLYSDAVAQARRFIYIENQYLTARSLGDAIAARLAEADGPEVVIVLPKQTGGWLEQVTMDVLRGRLVGRLQQADQHGKLRVYFPHQPGLGDACISVHAKLLIVDDRLLRIGSSNASNRSMGLDTECDLAIEARGNGDSVQECIRRLRHRLLAEHLDCAPERIADLEAENGGLIQVIECLQTDQRSLHPLDCSVPETVNELVPDARVIDPPEPLSPEYFIDEYVPEPTRTTGQRRLAAFLLLLIGLLVVAAAWRWTPLQEWVSPLRIGGVPAALPSLEIRALTSVAVVTVASLLMIPLTLLAVVAGIVFQDWQAFVYVLLGAVISSALGFLGGRILNEGHIEKISGSRVDNLSRRLARRGTVAVTVLRMVPIAPFAVFNLVAGASKLGFRQFIVGSFLGLAPGLFAVTLFSGTLWAAITDPSLGTITVAAAVGGAIVVVALLAKRWLRSG
jgi:phospholipase D1/2